MSDPQSRRFNQIIADYLRAVESGKAPDREGLFDEYPELADDLRSFFLDYDRMQAAREGIAASALPPRQLASETASMPQSKPLTHADEAMAPPSGGSGTHQVGDKVRYFGDYELLREIARGGMGVVYKARQTSLNRLVALKMILAAQLAGEEDVQRFHAEAEAAANLDHPGIVPIYEVGEHEGQHYFSMGFVEGHSLADRLKNGPLPPREAAEIVKQIAEAIAYAHERGVIHRDLKPANVLIDQSGQPKVTDFGLAKRVEGDHALTATGQILGTPSYMPPEQASGKTDQVGPLSDVYALGAILYCLVTGRPAFQSANPLDTLIQVLEQEPVPPSQLNAAAPKDLETICLKCLEKDPSRRYASAGELVAELKRFLAGEPIMARPISVPGRAWRWCRRKPVIAGLLAGVAFLLVGGIATSSFFAFRANRNAEEAESHLYASLLARVQQHLAEGQHLDARWLLERCPAEMRDWEWRFLWRQSRAQRSAVNTGDLLSATYVFGADEHYLVTSGGTIVNAHTGAIITRVDDWLPLATGPRGDLAAGVDPREPTRVRVVELKTGKTIQLPDGHEYPVRAIHFHPDASRMTTLAIADETWECVCWDLESRKPTNTFAGSDVELLDISPCGGFVLGRVEEHLHLWDVEVGELLLRLPSDPIVFRALGRKRLFYVTNNGGMFVWDGKEHRSLHLGEEFRLNEARFDNHGAYLATQGHVVKGDRLSDASVLRIWDVATGRIQLELAGQNVVEFSPDGSTLVTDSQPMLTSPAIDVWDLANKRRLRTLKYSGQTGVTSFSKFVVSPASDLVAGFASTRQVVPSGKSQASPIEVTSPMSQWVVWQVRERSTFELPAAAEKATAIGFGPDSESIAVARQTPEGHLDTVAVVSVSRAQVVPINTASPESFRLVQTRRPRPNTLYVQEYEVTDGDAEYRASYVSPEGLPLLGAVGEGELTIWRRNRKLHTLKGHGVVEALALSPDGRLLATARSNDAAALQSNIFTALAGDWESGDIDLNAEITVWAVPSGRVISRFRGHRGHVCCLAFNPAGTRLASVDLVTASGTSDLPRGDLIVWNVSDGQPVLKVPADPGGYRAVCFSPNGRRLAALGTSLVIWDGGELDLDPIQVRADDATNSSSPQTASPRRGQQRDWIRPRQNEARCAASPVQDTQLQLIDCEQGRIRRRLQLKEGRPVEMGNEVYSVALHPAGQQVALGERDGVRVFDAASGQQRAFIATQSPVMDLAFASDGDTLTYFHKEARSEHAAQIVQHDLESGGSRQLRVEQTASWNLFPATRLDLQANRLLCADEKTVNLLDTSSWPDDAGNKRQPAPTIASFAFQRYMPPVINSTVFTKVDMNLQQKLVAAGTWSGTIFVWSIADSNEHGLPQRVIDAHSDYVSQLAFSRDGRWLFSASSQDQDNNIVKIWDIASAEASRVPALDSRGKTATPARTLAGHQGYVSGLAMSEDGRLAATSGEDHTVRIWDVESGGLIRVIDAQSVFTRLSFFSDGDKLVACRDGVITIWTIDTGRQIQLLESHLTDLHRSAVSADGKLVATLGANHVKLWDSAKAEERWSRTAYGSAVVLDSLSQQVFVREYDRVQCLNFADGSLMDNVSIRGSGPMILLPRQRRLIVAGSYLPDQVIRSNSERVNQLTVWDLDARRQHAQKRLPVGSGGHSIAALAGTLDESLVTSALGSDIHVLDADSLEAVASWKNTQQEDVTALAMVPDGRRIVVASADATVRIWDLERQTPQTVLQGHTESVQRVAVSTDGRLVASSGGGETIIWLTDTGETLMRVPGSAGDVTFSPAGDWLMIGAEFVSVPQASKRAAEISQPGDARTIEFSPDGTRFAAGGGDGTVYYRDTKTRHLVFSLVGHTAPVTSLAFSIDGRHMASASSDQTIRIWDCELGRPEQVLRGHDWEVADIAFTPDDSRLASASSLGQIHIWEIDSGARQASFNLSEGVRWLAFHQDGEQLIAANDRQVWTWHWRDREPAARRAAAGRFVALSSDGGTLAELSPHGTLHLHSLFSQIPPQKLMLDVADVLTVKLSNDGRWVVLVGSDRASLWDAQHGARVISTAADADSQVDVRRDGSLLLLSRSQYQLGQERSH